MLELKHISKTFFPGTVNAKTALDDLSLTLHDGDFVTVIGGNGAGKSTTLNAVAGVWPVDSGKIVIDGVDVTGLPEHKRAKYIGRVFQDPMTGTAATMQIEENLALAYSKNTKGLFRFAITKKDREMFCEALKRFDMGLEDRMATKIGLLSGGQRQRIIIARCLVVTPKIIFADEPISALDVSLQAQVINMLMDLQDKYKLSMLLIAHDLAVVRQIADQIKIMYFGEIVESAPSSEIYKNAQHPYTKVLLKAAPSISKGLEDAGFDIDLKPGDIPDPAKPMPGCPFCTRCIYADERCMKERPEETEVSPGHTVRCHKAGQI